jgi:hypothetical protein
MANIFDGTFSGFHGETIAATTKGFVITARLEHDSGMEPPWTCDLHGPVSEWTHRCKAPGERILCTDRDARRYYDVAEATRIARRDKWDAPPYGEGTAGQRAARAVEADFRNLKAWCNDEWYYVGVVLSVARNGIELDACAASLWGIESNSGEYLTEAANELVDEALDVGRAKLAGLRTLTDDDFEDVDDEPAGKPQVLLPDWLVIQYEQRAAAEREDGGSCTINERLPTIAVTLASGAEYFFQEHEASALLDSVPDNLTAEDFILASAQNW